MTMHTTTSHHVLATARLWTAAAGIILAVGTGTLAAQSDPPRSTDTDASYSTVWERGTEFIVGSSPEPFSTALIQP